MKPDRAKQGPTRQVPAAAPGADDPVWDDLRRAATGFAKSAYCPYSGFAVGAAGLADDGRIVGGCNVENVSFGVTLCAECGLVSDLVAGGGGKLLAFVCLDGDGAPVAPCGRCRQLLAEHAAPGMVLAMPAGLATIDEVLPQAFLTPTPGGAGALPAKGKLAQANERNPRA